MDELYIGLMSGTSIDGIDAVLVDLSGNKFRLIDSLYSPYSGPIKSRLDKMIKENRTALAETAELDNELARLNARAVSDLLAKHQEAKNKIRAIGYHGQTVFHQPEGNNPNSVQLGDPNVLAEKTGLKVVADFRRMDMAAGGQGAPLVPGFHQFLFRDTSENRAILNIGGIANLTILPADKSKPVTGFDTGPGNCLMDEWIGLQGRQFDKGGEWASQGQPNKTMLNTLLVDPYFSKAPPKSTGREYFHLDWLREHADIVNQQPQDIQATLSHLTACSVAQALREYAAETQQVFVCGGGIHNRFLFSILQQQLGDIKLASTGELGLDPDWVEACAFAWLAQQRIEKRPANIPSVTGASKPVLLGAVYE